MGKSVASVTGYLPLQPFFQSLQDFVIFILIFIVLLQVTAVNLCHLLYYFRAWNDFRIFKLRIQASRAVFHSKHGKIFVEPKLSRSTKQRGTRQRITKQIYVFLYFLQHCGSSLTDVGSLNGCFSWPLALSFQGTVTMLTWHTNKTHNNWNACKHLSLSNIGAVCIRLLDNAKGSRYSLACILFEGS